MQEQFMRYLPLFVGLRYTRAGTQGHVISFKAIASVLGLALGVAVLIIVLSVVNGFERELEQKILGIVPHATLYSDRPIKDWKAVSNRVLANSKFKEQVVAISPLINFQAILVRDERLKIVSIQGVVPSAELQTSIIHQNMKQGEFENLGLDKFTIILGSALADTLNVEVGEQVELVMPETNISLAGVMPRYKRFRVIGIFEIGAELDAHMAYIHIDDAAKLKRSGKGATSLRLKMNRIFDAAYDAWLIAEFLNRDTATGKENEMGSEKQLSGTLANQNDLSHWVSGDWTGEQGSLYEIIRMTKSMLGLLVLLIIIVATFNIVSSLIMLVNDKRADIAIMMSMGISPSTLMFIFIIQGMLIGLLGLSMGYLLGFGLLAYLREFVTWLESSLSLDLTSSYPVHYLPSHIILGDIVVVSLVALLLSFVATLYPAYLASKVDPAKELKFE